MTEKYETFKVTFENEEYDIADFIYKHPGGSDVLIDYKDKDITKAFNHIGHSEGAKMMLRKRAVKKEKKDEDEHVEEEAVANIDAKFVYKKLFTPEDKYMVHKTLGFLSLLSYIYRYFYVFPTTGSLGITQDTFTYVCLLIHTLLSCSSLIFHVLKYRIKENPLIIYEEYRLHAILFTIKAMLATVYGLNLHYVPTSLRAPILAGSMLASHATADWITHKYGKKGVSAVRNDNKSTGIIKFGMRGYAFYQILGQGAVLRLHPMLPDLGFNALIAIQSSAFLMTLKRKNLIDWPVHAAGYSISLILSTAYIWYAMGTAWIVYMSVIFICRTQLNMSKYVLWSAYLTAGYFLLE